MAKYQYQAVDKGGRRVAGELEADSVEQAVALLLSGGLTTHAISRADSQLPGQAADVSFPGASIPGQHATAGPPPFVQNIEKAVLQSHMATILARGRAIAPALRAYAAEMPFGWQRRQLLAVCRILDRGDPGDAAKSLADLPESWIPLLSAATASPDPGHVLQDFLNESRRADALRQQWWLTLAYPVVLMCLATAVLTALAIFIIPQFREIFDEFGLELPELTKMVLGFAYFLSNWGWLILLLLCALFAAMVLYANRLLFSSVFTWLTGRLRLPFAGRTSVARFARFMADLLEAGVRTPDALRIAGFSVNRSRMQRAAWRLANDIESTGEFSQQAYARPLTTSIVYALAADLPTESRVRLLREISNSHADRVRINLSWAQGFVEPMAILVVGLAVAWTVIGLFLPLVKLIEGLSM